MKSTKLGSDVETIIKFRETLVFYPGLYNYDTGA